MMRSPRWPLSPAAWLRRRSSSGAIILMYHRVAEVDADPWGLCVSPTNFAAHLEIVRRLASPLALRRLVDTGGAAPVGRGSVVLTLDDGYVDALDAATLLRAHDVPATVFVTTGNVGRDREFWWDELGRILLLPGTLPATLELCIGGRWHRWELGEATHYSETEYRANRRLQASDAGPGTRHALYLALWRRLVELTHPQRDAVLADLARWSGDREVGRPRYRSLDPGEIASLGDGGLVEVGAHTVTHPQLPNRSAAEQRSEIAGSRDALGRILGRPVTSFSYPHGEHSRTTVRLVREAGFDRACTVSEGSVRPGSDRFRLPRYNVLDWTAGDFEARLASWLGRSG
jgi:peptidoglycan/xylan/chitin deacetylase (PgdA/CDA1 family)